MTTPQQSPGQLFDAGNILLAQGPARLDTGSVTTPERTKVGIVTIRTSSTTLTVFVTAADLREWAGVLSGLADQMTGGLVTATAADVATVNQEASNHRRR